MKIYITQLKFIAITLFMIVVPSLCMAGEQELLISKNDPTTLMLLISQNDPTTLNDGEAIRLSDEALLSIRGLGDEGAPLIIPGQISVILWDELGSGDSKTRHNTSSGSGNTQNVNLILINGK